MNKINHRAIIFCQAPIEIVNVADLYFSIYKKYDEIAFVSLSTNSYNAFFKYHQINATFIYIPPTKPYSLNWFINWRKQFEKYLKVLNLESCDIYFTSRFDSKVALFLKYASPSCNIFYRYNKDEIWTKCSHPHLKIKTILKFYLYKIITKAPISMFAKGQNSILPEIQLKKFNINMTKWENDFQIIEKLSYKPKKQTKAAILFTEPYRNKFQAKQDYDDLNLQIVKYLHNNGYYIVMKGHPRIGIHPLLADKVDEILPEFIPSEFINLKSFTLAIGFVSTALCESAKIIPTYSVLEMCHVQDNTEYKYWKDFLNGFNTPIVYIKDLKEIHD